MKERENEERRERKGAEKGSMRKKDGRDSKDGERRK